MKLKRIISTIIILSFIASVFIPAHIEAADTSVYSCDFSKLVKDGQKHSMEQNRILFRLMNTLPRILHMMVPMLILTERYI